MSLLELFGFPEPTPEERDVERRLREEELARLAALPPEAREVLHRDELP